MTAHPTDQPHPSGSHPANVAHLVFGVVFVGLAATWLLRATGVIDHDDLGWVLPLTPILAGVAGLTAAAVARRLTTRLSDEPPPAGPDPEEQR